MAVPASGQLCMQGLAKEKVYDNYASPSSVTPPISLYDLVHGGNSCGSGNSYDATNTASPSYPPVVNTNLCFSAWYSYDHDYPTGPSWSTGGAVPACRAWGGGSGASCSDAILVGGACYDGPGGNRPSNANNTTYEYNGTSWSSGGNTPAANLNAAVSATSNDAVAYTFRTGAPFYMQWTKGVYHYNGSTWASETYNEPFPEPSCRVDRTPGTGQQGESSVIYHIGGDGAGCQTWRAAALGSSWYIALSCNLIASCRCAAAHAGYSTLTAGGDDLVTTGGYGANGSSAMCTTEERTGTGAWSSGGNLITRRLNLMALSQGTSNNFCVAGGNESPIYSCTEIYNGTSWSAGPAMITAVRNAQSGGGTTSGLVAGGICSTGGYAITTTQELS